MEWYYGDNGQQKGPLTEAQFQQLVGSGTITPQTLVWHAGMDQWRTYGELHSPASSPSASQAVCTVCQKNFSKDALISYENLWVCGTCKPIFFQKMREGVAVSNSAIFRSGSALIMGLETSLPDRCVKCNAPAGGKRMKRRLYWHHPLLYFLIPVGLLFYALVVLLVRKKAVVEIGICEKHFVARKKAILISWLVFAAGIGCIPVGIHFGNGWFGLATIIITLFAIVFGMLKTRLVLPKKIDKEHLWLKGTCKEFVAEFPEWKG